MNPTPKGELVIRVLALPRDTNPTGDIFGGWLISQMDMAGAVFCSKLAQGRVATVAIASISFKHPVLTGDTLCVYVSLNNTGRTSISVHIEAFVEPATDHEQLIKVTAGEFTYVKVDENRAPSPLPDTL